jgi:hypothetical protein
MKPKIPTASESLAQAWTFAHLSVKGAYLCLREIALIPVFAIFGPLVRKSQSHTFGPN